ncbi:MAG: histidine--tRNA ligase [Rikenellaceae bacterium]|nr:histidine--tRNA ligase [Rikenellaceae bacterium]
MAVQKPSIPSGTRDFGPEQMIKRNYIFDTIRDEFKTYGYLPLETPSMEKLSTLLGKYGEEGDKLLFRILNSGDFLSKVPEEKLTVRDSAAVSPVICERGLRYDLTVPFARYVVQHRNDIVFPFKRYQIQPVWRADRPQKGRYREFYQCDVDVVGSRSLIYEVELIQIVESVFTKLGINVTLKVNNRKILYGISEAIGHTDKMMDITVAIDKLEKVGFDNVAQELSVKGIDDNAIEKLKPILELDGDNRSKIETITRVLSVSEIGMKGIGEISAILDYTDVLGINLDIELDLSLARGLNYYTGAIFEVKAKDYAIGSICGGGRYDDLTGIFGMPDTSGVGISFGADRIYDVMEGLGLFPDASKLSTKILFLNFDAVSEKESLKVLRRLRNIGIPSEIYPENAKLKKQMEYANRRKIPFVGMIGEEELKSGTVTVKNMADGSQQKMDLNEIDNFDFGQN